MRTLTKQTKAFTMLELVFVIVVLGIIAALALPRMDRDLRQEAADNILSAIRYTQHLALNDDKTNPFGGNWQRALWQIRFMQSGSTWSYTIGANNDYTTGGTSIDKIEAAIDPMNGQYMFNDNPTNPLNDESPNIFITKKYGIDTVTFNNCQGTQNTTANHIAFDHLGRPHRGITDNGSNDYRTYVKTGDCTITFTFQSSGITPLVLNIAQETGYAHIVGQEDS
ncbi:Tfp pilus assembly protein FimT/FimU [Campylobacterota bacterium]